MHRLSVAVAGATGLVGQHLLRMLEEHPWLEARELVASPRSAGQRYGAATDWSLPGEMPRAVRDRALFGPEATLDSPLVLSALPAAAARLLEPQLAERGHLVCSNASAFRDHPGVPLVVPEVNGHALAMVRQQPWWRGAGGIVTNPNCMVSGLSLALAPLQRAFGIESATVCTLQALSGAGLAGLNNDSAPANVVPWIDGEASKIATEPGKILEACFPMSVMVNRVPVIDGHMASVFVRLRGRPGIGEIRDALLGFRAPDEVAGLPSSPERPLVLMDAPGRPQPRLDISDGMTVAVGNLSEDPTYDVRFTVLVHNLVRGAAGACLLNAELAVVRQLVGIPRKPPGRIRHRPQRDATRPSS